MPIVETSDFERDFDRLLDAATREQVEISRHGRREYVLMSVEHHEWLKAAVRRAHRTADAAEVVVAAVERANMDAS